MNIEKLKLAESRFLSIYPKGFADPAMEEVSKRHKMDTMIEFAQANFTPDCSSHVDQTIENMVKIVSRSSMVLMFEKPKFKNFSERLDRLQRGFMVDSLIEFLHGDQQVGLEGMVELLLDEKLAKWSLVSVIPAYYAPTKEVFVKPTTAKGVITEFEVEGLHYKPRPSWEFYKAYRSMINKYKKEVDATLSPSNAAFSGFLMMSL